MTPWLISPDSQRTFPESADYQHHASLLWETRHQGISADGRPFADRKKPHWGTRTRLHCGMNSRNHQLHILSLILLFSRSNARFSCTRLGTSSKTSAHSPRSGGAIERLSTSNLRRSFLPRDGMVSMGRWQVQRHYRIS